MVVVNTAINWLIGTYLRMSALLSRLALLRRLPFFWGAVLTTQLIKEVS